MDTGLKSNICIIEYFEGDTILGETFYSQKEFDVEEMKDKFTSTHNNKIHKVFTYTFKK